MEKNGKLFFRQDIYASHIERLASYNILEKLKIIKIKKLTGESDKNIFTDDSKAEDISKCKKKSEYFKTNSTRSEIKILDEHASKKNGLYFPIFLIHCDSKNQYYTGN